MLWVIVDVLGWGSIGKLGWTTAAVLVVAFCALVLASGSPVAPIDRSSGVAAAEGAPTGESASPVTTATMTAPEQVAMAAPTAAPTITIDAAPSIAVAAPRAQPAGRELQPRLVDARADGDGLTERGCGLSLPGAQPPLCVLGDPGGTHTLALVGDSHAGHWFPALELVARERHWRLIPLTKDSCTFLDMRIVSVHLGREYLDCARWRTAVVGVLQQLQPDLVMVSSSRWVHPVLAVDADADRQADAMARLLSALPGRIVLMADTPLSAVDVPACLSRFPTRPEQCATAVGSALSRQFLRDGPAAERSGATLVDPASWFCGPEVCPAVIDSTIVYRDDHHVTATFSRTLAPRLDAALSGLMTAIEMAALPRAAPAQ